MNFQKLKKNRIYTKLSFQDVREKESVIQVLELSRDVWNYASERFFELYKRGYRDRSNPIVHQFNSDINEAIVDLFNVDKDFAIFVKRSVLNTYFGLPKGEVRSKPLKTKKLFLFHRFSTLHLPMGRFNLYLLKRKFKCWADKEEEISQSLPSCDFENVMIKYKKDEVWLSIPRRGDASESNESDLTEVGDSLMMSDDLTVDLPEWLEDDQEDWAVTEQDDR